MVPRISMIVNIDPVRYHRRVKIRSIDPEIRLLQALGDPTRLAIVRQLAADGETCACDFTACCDVRQPTISHHLRVLREAGAIVGERRGTWIWYRLDPSVAERVGSIARALEPGGLITVAELTARRAAPGAGASEGRPSRP